jgi:uncharacterized protein YdaU (DUF1376 family)
MAKDPAFLFYTNDFLSGIQDLTFEERGQYITLLCLQHQKGHLSDKLIKLSVGNAAADVMAKFRQDSAGFWFNARLDIEIEKRKAHALKQSERASEGWKKRKNDAKHKPEESHGNATAMPLEDVNVIEDVNENKKGNTNKEPLRNFFEPDVKGDDIIFPLDTKPVRELWAKWKEYRFKNHNQSYRMYGEQADLKRLEGKQFTQIQETILAAISNNWKNLYPDSNGKSKQNNGLTKVQQQQANNLQANRDRVANTFGKG